MDGIKFRTGVKMNEEKVRELAQRAEVNAWVSGGYVYIEGYPKGFRYNNACAKLRHIARLKAEGLPVPSYKPTRTRAEVLQELADKVGVDIRVSGAWVFIGTAERANTFKQALAKLKYQEKKQV